MNLHLVEIARRGPSVPMQSCFVDQAGWYVTAALIIASKYQYHPAASHVPELNPNRKHLGNPWIIGFQPHFETYDDIVDHCCDALNKLIASSKRIVVHRRRQWRRSSDQCSWYNTTLYQTKT
jgi:hypothetical protein